MRRQLTLALTTALLLSSHAATVRAQRRATAAPRIVAANVLDAMYFKERAESEIAPAALAAYGNRLVARRGLDHIFDACAVLRADRNPRPVAGAAESTKVFRLKLRRVVGGELGFLLIADILGETEAGATCGCFFGVPALRVTAREMTVVAGGRPYRVARPAGFFLSEASLVDESLKNVRRTWQLPYEAAPLGLSADRARLYLPLPEFDGETWDDRLALELSDAGPRFVTRAGLALPPRAETLAAPPGDAAAYTRFGAGAQSYVLRLRNDCQ